MMVEVKSDVCSPAGACGFLDGQLQRMQAPEISELIGIRVISGGIVFILNVIYTSKLTGLTVVSTRVVFWAATIFLPGVLPTQQRAQLFTNDIMKCLQGISGKLVKYNFE